MIQTIQLSSFRDAFHHAGRGKQFSYEALELLFDYLEELNPNYDLDVVALCCGYSEDTVDEIIDSYSIDSDSWDSLCTASAYGLEQVEKVKLAAVMEYLEENTSIVGTTSSGYIVYAQF